MTKDNLPAPVSASSRLRPLWRHAQQRKELNDFLFPELQKQLGLLSDLVQDMKDESSQDVKISLYEEELINDILSLKDFIDQSSILGDEVNNAIQAAFGHMLEGTLDDEMARNELSHLTMIFEQLPMFFKSDVSTWEYILVLVDLEVFQEALESMSRNRLQDLRDRIDKIMEYKALADE